MRQSINFPNIFKKIYKIIRKCAKDTNQYAKTCKCPVNIRTTPFCDKEKQNKIEMLTYQR